MARRGVDLTGAHLVLANSTTAGGGGGGSTTISPALAWNNIFASFSGGTDTPTVAGIGQPVSITASLTGAGTLSYVKNGVVTLYTGAFNVSAGDTLGWYVTCATKTSGVISPVNATTSAALATINYHLITS